MTALRMLSLVLLATPAFASPQFGGGFGGNFGGNNGGFNGGNNGFNFGDFDSAQAIRVAHGVLAALAFVIFFPAGAITIRILPGRLSFILHILFQLLAYLLYIVAFGLGVWLAVAMNFGPFDFFSNPSQNYHPIIGIVIFAFLFFQPILGIIHHVRFKKLRRRQFVSHIHLWLGRILITLGIINGGLGLMLANASSSLEIAYGVVAGGVWLIWVLAAIFGEFRRARKARRAKATEIREVEVDSRHTDYVQAKGTSGTGKTLLERFR